MNKTTLAWNRLVSAARRHPGEQGDCVAPAGFATRVVARGLVVGAAGGISAVFERLAPRALGLATLMMMLALTWNFLPTSTVAAEEYFEGDLMDPVGEVLALMMQ